MIFIYFDIRVVILEWGGVGCREKLYRIYIAMDVVTLGIGGGILHVL